jgi:transcriptional regulator with XRE-family HTH domain
MTVIYRRFSPQRVRARRGDETRKAVIARADGCLSESELAAYETGAYKPSDTKMLHLLKALNCTYDDISEPLYAEAV